MFNSPPTQYDVSFRFLNFPVRVHPMFWLVMLLFGIVIHPNIDGGHLSFWLAEIVLWVAAAFVSILVHELGHGLVFRHLYRVPSAITLHGMGGVTVPYYQYRKGSGFRGLLGEVFLSAAGALGEFLLAGVFILLLAFMHMGGIRIAFFLEALNPISILTVFMVKTIVISIFWGLFNLLPIYPMDGGQIFREIFSYFSPRRGVGNSLALSMGVAILLAVLAIQWREYFIAILFAFFAYQNYRELTFRSF